MIKNPNDIREGEKKIRMLIAGYPGIGKSTLALFAPKPLHIDADFGVDRVEPRYRAPYIQPATYQEILDDLTPENVRDFETLVFDTGGRLVTLIGLWAIHNNPRMGQAVGLCLRLGLFDKGLFERHGILTSRRIQETYVTATKKSKRLGNAVIDDYWLLGKKIRTGRSPSARPF